jgi:hypothetical protein
MAPSRLFGSPPCGLALLQLRCLRLIVLQSAHTSHIEQPCNGCPNRLWLRNALCGDR